jgi:hypothetical protein
LLATSSLLMSPFFFSWLDWPDALAGAGRHLQGRQAGQSAVMRYNSRRKGKRLADEALLTLLNYSAHALQEEAGRQACRQAEQKMRPQSSRAIRQAAC